MVGRERSVRGGGVGRRSLARRLRRALPAESEGRAKAIGRLASARIRHAHASRFGRLTAVPASTRLCRPSSRVTCASLFCALVIPSALFQSFCGPALPFHPRAQVRGASGRHCRTRLALMPPKPLGVATRATSAPTRRNAIASVNRKGNGPSSRSRIIKPYSPLRYLDR